MSCMNWKEIEFEKDGPLKGVVSGTYEFSRAGFICRLTVNSESLKAVLFDKDGKELEEDSLPSHNFRASGERYPRRLILEQWAEVKWDGWMRKHWTPPTITI